VSSSVRYDAAQECRDQVLTRRKKIYMLRIQRQLVNMTYWSDAITLVGSLAL
jgi:hypothetical protein